jgi:uncharacterized protein YdaU (DUF1376 family)
MNGLPYYKAYPRDFIEGTIGMSFDVKCAYRVLLDLIYMRGGRLVDDDRYISGIMGCSVRKWKTIRDDLIRAGKIQAADGHISNERADKELETLSKLQDKQAENARGPRKNNGLEKPRQNHTEPEPERKKEVKPSSAPAARDGADADLFQAFWETYPHRGGAKKGRAAALKAWVRAINAREPPESIIAGAQRYAADRQVIRGYAKDPATWLNGKGWQDEIEKAVNSGASNERSAKGASKLSAFLGGAAAPGMDWGQDCNPPRALLARG